MPTKLTKKADEGGTYVVVVTFSELGELVIPNSGLKWNLSDKNGNIINDKQDVDIDSDSTINIVVKGDDLLLNGAPALRFITIVGTYDSDLQNDLPLVKEVSFQIDDLVGKP